MYFDPNENLINTDMALAYWCTVAGSLTLIVMLFSLIGLLSSRGLSGVQIFFSELGAMIWDTINLSPRRIWALTRLTFMEAYRRRVLMIFVVFALLFMFAGWFLGDTKEITPDRIKVYISFVLTSISWLTLPIILLLACFGIPEDIRLRSIHTVVTKPARRIEIVIGRMLGISSIGLLVLLVMGTVGYIWIVRQMPSDNGARDLLTCRVAKYGGLRFLTREGEPGDGVNVGDIWAFRSYIEGGSKARALWMFTDVDESVLDGDGNLNLENSFSAFRSYKGDMTRPLYYDIKFHGNQPGLFYTTDPKPVAEFRSRLDKINRKITINDTQYDLLKDFVTNDPKINAKNALVVEISCIDQEQYIGMARPDLFIRLPDQPFWVGYSKALFGIGLVIVLFSMISVAASTIVKGPIAVVLTLVLYLISGKQAHQFIDQLASGQLKGGGVLESIYRIVTHMGPFTELPDSMAFNMMKFIDTLMTGFLWICKQMIPRLQSFNMTEFVANGFDVPFNVSIYPSILVVASFVIPCVMLGYFALRVRELESK